MWDAQDSVDEVHDKYTKEKQELTTCFDEVLPFLLESFWIWFSLNHSGFGSTTLYTATLNTATLTAGTR